MKAVKTKVLILFLGLLFSCSAVGAFADDHGPMGGQHTAMRHSDHYYRNGHWYRHGWFGWEVGVPVLSSGVYVNTLPPAYTPVVIQGTTYYYGDNTYFVASPEGGYTVVAAPR